MARRFRRTRGFRRRGPMARPLWARNESVVTLDATLRSLIIVDPTVLPGSAAGFDYRRTILRCIIEPVWRPNAHATTTNSIIHCDVFWGLYVETIGNVHDPRMISAGDRAADWMDLGVIGYTVNEVVSNQVMALTPAPGQTQALHRDIRVKRKINDDQQLILSFVANIRVGTLDSGDGTILFSTLMKGTLS